MGLFKPIIATKQWPMMPPNHSSACCLHAILH
jgi:hypothetical protein